MQKGSKHTEAAKKALRDKATGRFHSEETKQVIAEKMKKTWDERKRNAGLCS